MKIKAFAILLIVTPLLLSCGGGGGGGAAAVTCTPTSSDFFYEVTQNLTCANSASNNLVSSSDFSGSYAFSDGGSGGGDGGGGGGGGGAGDLFIRIVQSIKSNVYALLGIGNAYAQSVSACGANVSQSDLNKLTATKWQFQPLVKAGVAAGTVCVNRIFDANKYIAVYASGLTKFDQTCVLVMVNKKDGSTHCFASNADLKLEDEALLTPPTSNYTDLMSPSLYSSPSMSLSDNKKYFGVVFHTETNGAAYRQRMVRLGVDSDAAFTKALVFDSDNLNTTSPWNGNLTRKFMKQLLLNNGQATVHYYDANRSVTATGYTYVSDENSIASPTLVNSDKSNPQCVLQSPLDDASFVGVFKTTAGGANYGLFKLQSGALQVVKNNVGDLCKAALTQGNYYYSARRYDAEHDVFGQFSNSYSGMFMGYEVSRLDLTQGDSQSPVSAFKIQPYNPAANSITCADGRTIAMPSTKDQSLDSVTMFLDKNGKFLLGMRSSIEFDSSANVVRNSVLAGKGLSTLVSVAYDSAANTNTKTTL